MRVDDVGVKRREACKKGGVCVCGGCSLVWTSNRLPTKTQGKEAPDVTNKLSKIIIIGKTSSGVQNFKPVLTVHSPHPHGNPLAFTVQVVTMLSTCLFNDVC